LISAYELDLHHGTAYVTLALLPGYRLRVWPLEATILFANYLFVRFNLRKLCGRSVQRDFVQLRSGADHFFDLEGVLHDHAMIDGETQDLYLAAVDRERWLRVGQPLLDRIRAPAV
jgi:hypothetical protein